MAEIKFISADTPPVSFNEELILAVETSTGTELVRGRWTEEGWFTYSSLDLSFETVLSWVYFEEVVIQTQNEIN